MSRVSTAVAQAILKQASYVSIAKERNYTPPRAKAPVFKQEDVSGRKIKAKSEDVKGNTVVNWGKNKPDHSGYLPLTENRLLDYHNTISGTGRGRPYWGEKNNPFEA